MIIIWIWAYNIKNAGVVDIFWGINFLVIAVVSGFSLMDLKQENLLYALLPAL